MVSWSEFFSFIRCKFPPRPAAVIEYFIKATPPEKEVLVPELSVFDTFPAPMLPARPSLFLVINHSLCCQWTLFDKDIEAKKVKDLFKDNQKAALCLEDKKFLIRGRGPCGLRNANNKCRPH